MAITYLRPFCVVVVEVGAYFVGYVIRTYLPYHRIQNFVPMYRRTRGISPLPAILRLNSFLSKLAPQQIT